MALIPGLCGVYLRRAFYQMTLTECANDCFIGFGTIFSTNQVKIGPRVYIGAYCIIGEAVIEEDCLISSRVNILSGKHQHSFKDLTIPIREQLGAFEQVRIGRDTWVGQAATIMANIGEQCVIAAGSVVFHDISDRSIVRGNPAEIIKTRQ
ncbi:MAG: DapH/DapD/GlmU-related protein [Chlamydiota bacterium]|nr:DapH/DapD/GlmU-related protein [Chlamydiota bacterium]